MSGDFAIRFTNVSKMYKLYDSPISRLKEAISPFSNKYHQEFYALHDVSFEIRRGESIGIIGKNGSGKSTLLKILSGTLSPTSGSICVNGRVSALLELGAGFNPELSGIENIYFNGLLNGFTKSDIKDRLEGILSFADIGEFVYQPVKAYSSGMFVRLAFAVAVNVEPDILVIDEALAVGDSLFQKRCYRRIEELKARGATVLLVSHSQDSIMNLSAKAMLLDKGRLVSMGVPSRVILDYRMILHEDEKKSAHEAQKNYSSIGIADRAATSFGDLQGEILSVSIFDASGAPSDEICSGDVFAITITCKINIRMKNLNVAFRIRNKQGIKVASWGTLNEDIICWASNNSELETFWDREVDEGTIFKVTFRGKCTLAPDLYEVQATITQELDRYYMAQKVLHWVDEAAIFTVYNNPKEYQFGGICDLNLRSDALQCC